MNLDTQSNKKYVTYSLDGADAIQYTAKNGIILTLEVSGAKEHILDIVGHHLHLMLKFIISDY